ncbi:MAG: AAA family ATPase [Pseudobutyrivibrio sp.]|nr:AAA family ATPase [Pseudobutyrivibrio sp.]
MGFYLNPDNTLFKEAVEREIYVDKTHLIEKVYSHAKKHNKYICFSRPRRFGKSTDISMLAAYFSKGCKSKEIFDGFNIAHWDGYEEHINDHNVIYLNMQSFLSETKNVLDMMDYIHDELNAELNSNGEVISNRRSLADLLKKCYGNKQDRYIFLIDEWDCVFRECKDDIEAQNEYLNFLRLVFKDQPYVEMVYMTGILPIKKYGTHSALNMFDEISMVEANEFSDFMGFTDSEVKSLCDKYDADYEGMRQWYDGYHMDNGVSTYSPRSVTASISSKKFSNYWSQTETFDALRTYIDLNFDGLKDTVISLLAGETQMINVRTFQNGMNTFQYKDDVLTLLVHLGYLGYNYSESTVYVPNLEVKDTFVDSIQVSGWDKVAKIFVDSNDLLAATWSLDSKKVAAFIEKSHYETSILQYNDENALSYTVNLAYISAREYYTITRELPAGKGFADIVFIPRKGSDKPAMIVELKWDKDADCGIEQIKDKKYYLGLDDYLDNLLLVGISYDKDSKKHECVIESFEK